MVYQLIHRKYGNTRYRPLDGDMDDARVLHPDLAHPVVRHRGRAVNSGYPLDPATVPKKFLWGGNTLEVPDMIAYRGPYIISERFRDLIESFEPNVHQFLPIDFERPNGSHAARHFLMQACNRINSVDAEQTTSSCYFGNEGGTRNCKVFIGGELVFNLCQIGSAHLWVDNNLPPDNFCSNNLGDGIINMGLKGVRPHFFRDV